MNQKTISFFKILCTVILILSSPPSTHAISEADLRPREELARLITCEIDKNAPYICKVAFAAVILNRAASPQFPNTITGVIMEFGEFKSVRNGQYFRAEPHSDALRAARDALLGADPTNGAIYCFKKDAEITKQRSYMKKTLSAGEYVFYK